MTLWVTEADSSVCSQLLSPPSAPQHLRWGPLNLPLDVLPCLPVSLWLSTGPGPFLFLSSALSVFQSPLSGSICVALVCFRPLGFKDGCLWSTDPLSIMITQRTGPFKTTQITLMFAPCSRMPALG